MTSEKTQARVISADQVDPASLHDFLRREYPQLKSSFLNAHGAWWHSGDENRWVLVVGDTIAGYCAVIPTHVVVNGKPTSAIWWVDLVIAREFRGQGLQILFDEKIRGMDVLKLGFPNELAAKIHRKHHWGVRDDYLVVLSPLIPRKVIQVHTASGLRGLMFRSVAGLLTPFLWLCRLWVKRYHPVSAKVLEYPEPEFLADIFQKFQQGFVTTHRNAAFIRWRYLKSPHRSQYTYFVGGSNHTSSLIAVTRTLVRDGITVTRVLDIFGDLDDKNGLKDILRLVVCESAKNGASQVTAMVTEPSLLPVFRAVGFVFQTAARFCWYSDAPETMRFIEKERCYWTLADSDNDVPD